MKDDIFRGEEMVSKEILKKVDEILLDPKKVDKWMGCLQKREHVFYDWMQARSGGAIANMSRHIDLKVSDAHGVAHTLLCAFLSGYIISNELTNKQLNHLIVTPEKEFETWLEGKLPSNFYNYSLAGLAKNSPKYLAKKSHMEILKIIKEKKDSEEDFFQIKDNIPKGTGPDIIET